MKHVPVLTKEVIEALDPKQNENFIDCTVGQGGHAKLILEKTSPSGKVLGIDLDPSQIKNSRQALMGFAERLILVNDSYINLEKIVEENNFKDVSGILLDLGMSSWQLEGTEKGFSFQANQALDMRYDENRNELTAKEIVNTWSEEKIENILTEYGEEKFARKIARKIIEQRKIHKIESTFDLVEIIKEATPANYWNSKIHYATRTFQALRIAVNQELENVEKILPIALSILKTGGRLVVISFHSLEDRIVKNYFKTAVTNKIIELKTKKPITAEATEIGENPRSRSAKLRVAIKI
jgi:16S rRNA (cytosine1402-N4)-methyltransferase